MIVRDMEVPMSPKKANSKTKAQQRLIGEIMRLNTKEVKSVKFVGPRKDESSSEESPSTADTVLKINHKADDDSSYKSTKRSSRTIIEKAVRNVKRNKRTTKHDKCDKDLFEAVQDFKWRLIQCEDDILVFKAKYENSQLFFKAHGILKLPIINCIQGIPLDEQE